MAATVKITVDGTDYTATYSAEGGYYLCNVTAPTVSSYHQTGGYYPVAITATDDASNTATADDTHATLGDYLRLDVYESVPPAVTDFSPASGGYVQSSVPDISFKLSDNDSGVDLTTLVVTLDQASISDSIITKTNNSGVYTCSFTAPSALADGAHTLSVTVKDHDNNSKTETLSFYTDTTAPTLSVTKPSSATDITNDAAYTIEGTASDSSGVPDITITVNSVDAGTVVISGAGVFSHELTLTEGVNSIAVTATDEVGRTTTVTRTVTLDSTPPVITGVEITPNPVGAGGTYVIKVYITI